MTIKFHENEIVDVAYRGKIFVTYEESSLAFVYPISQRDSGIWLPLSCLTPVKPTWKIGDRVACHIGKVVLEANIIALWNNSAWVQINDDEPLFTIETSRLSNLK
jgi:hypothetical protein